MGYDIPENHHESAPKNIQPNVLVDVQSLIAKGKTHTKELNNIIRRLQELGWKITINVDADNQICISVNKVVNETHRI